MIHYSRRASRKSSHKDTEQYLRLDNVDAFSTTDALVVVNPVTRVSNGPCALQI